MNFILTVVITAIITFLLVFLSQKYWHNVPGVKGHHIHHSVLGILLIILGVVLSPIYGLTIFGIGLGIVLSHGVEEMFFNHKNIIEAFFVFVTKDERRR